MTPAGYIAKAERALSPARILLQAEDTEGACNRGYYFNSLRVSHASRAAETIDLLNTLAAIAGRGARFRPLGDAWADTTTAHGRLILTVLGGLAEFEHELIRVRTGEGRARAVANGVKMGRKPKLTPHQKREAIRRRDKGRGVACGDWPQLQC
jgi:DNA invertase Pin-like site-specific DNA recombinase